MRTLSPQDVHQSIPGLEAMATDWEVLPAELKARPRWLRRPAPAVPLSAPRPIAITSPFEKLPELGERARFDGDVVAAGDDRTCTVEAAADGDVVRAGGDPLAGVPMATLCRRSSGVQRGVADSDVEVPELTSNIVGSRWRRCRWPQPEWRCRTGL
jgi:hypothetical protein